MWRWDDLIDDLMWWQIAIVCGSGLGRLAELVTEAVVIPYAEVPGFPKSTGALDVL